MASISATTPKAVNVGQVRRSVASALIGNFMEFFDFAAYGFLALTIGATFFPSSNPTTQLLSSFAAFGVAFLFRPLGGALFGYLGDKFGRRTALVTAIISMTLATTCIGALPSHASAGVLAPILLVTLRCIQGLSVGGEFAGSSTFIIEYSKDNHRGLWSSFVSSTAAFGTVCGSLLVLLLTSTLSPQAMSSWGWRVPFLAAFPIGFIGLYMRLRLQDTPVFTEMQAATQKTSRNPFTHLTKADFRAILIVAAGSGATGLGFYTFSTYINTYLSANTDFTRPQAIGLSTISLLFYAAMCPLAGALSDRIGRRPTYLIGLFSLAALVIPIFALLGTTFGGALVGLLIYAFPQAMINVMVSLVLVEMFPAQVRVTGGALGNNIGVGLIAGTGPFVATALIAATGNTLAPAFYLGAIMLVVGIILALTLPETFRRSLRHVAAQTVGEPARKGNG